MLFKKRVFVVISQLDEIAFWKSRNQKPLTRWLRKWWKQKKMPYLMSISLNVVSIAYVFWASFNLWAILSLIRFILTLCSVRGEPLNKGCPIASTAPTLKEDTGVWVNGAEGTGGTGGGVDEVDFSKNEVSELDGDVDVDDGGGVDEGKGEGDGCGEAVLGAVEAASEDADFKSDVAPTLIVNTAWPLWTLDPSSIIRASMTPATGELIDTVVYFSRKQKFRLNKIENIKNIKTVVRKRLSTL